MSGGVRRRHPESTGLRMNDRAVVGIGMLIATTMGIALPLVAHAQPSEPGISREISLFAGQYIGRNASRWANPSFVLQPC